MLRTLGLSFRKLITSPVWALAPRMKASQNRPYPLEPEGHRIRKGEVVDTADCRERR